MTRPAGIAGWVDRLLERVLEGSSGRAIRADLHQEMAERAGRDGPAGARRWFVVQGASVALWALFDRTRGRAWGARSGGPGLRAALRDALRVFRRSPGYATTVVGTLAVAMGATISVFTVVRSVLLQELPFPEPDRLVRIDRLQDDGTPAQGGVSWLDAQDWRAELEGVTDLAAWQGFEATWVQDGLAEVWNGTASSGNLLALLGVEPLLGSFYDRRAGEGEVGENSLFLSHRIWTTRFGRDPSVVGRTIRLSDASWTVRGVLPADFTFPEASTDLWVPIRGATFLENRAAGFLSVVGRLDDAWSLDAAREELEAVAARLDEKHASEYTGVAMRRYADVLVAPVRRHLWMFMGAVAFFLVAACANVAGLALARVEARRRELVVRRSLGATRESTLRSLLLESTALSVAGGAVGCVLAWGGVRALLALAPADLPRRSEVALDPLVLATGTALAVVCGVVSGALPGLRGMRLSAAPLRSAGGARPRGQQRMHHLIAGAQIALAVVLLVGAGLLVRSFDRLTSVDTGYTAPERVFTLELGLGRERWGGAEEVLDFHRRLLGGVAAIPGAESVALTSHLPFSGASIRAAVVPAGRTYERDRAPLVNLEVVDGDYFAAMGIPLLRGRGLTDAGGLEARSVVVNQSAAETLWPGEDPLGQAFSFDVEEGERSPPESQYTVIGVVPDVLDGGLDAERTPRAYYHFPTFRRSWSFLSGRFFYLTVRSGHGDPSNLLRPIREVVAGLDATVPVRTPATLERRILTTALPARFRTVVLVFFGALAAVVALLGVYGVVAYGVRRGMRETGVRLALGASRRSVGGRILWSAARTALLGGGVGLVGALLLAPVLERALFGVDARDPLTFAVVVGTTVAGSVLAALLPARRATQLNPVEVMREE